MSSGVESLHLILGPPLDSGLGMGPSTSATRISITVAQPLYLVTECETLSVS